VTDLDGTPKPLRDGGPPILIGGGGRRILQMAAQCADIIQVLGASFGTSGAVVDDLSSFRSAAFEERLGWIEDSAGSRFRDIEFSLMLVFVAVTDDVETTAKGFLEFLSATVARYGGDVGDLDVRVEALLESPVVAIGNLDAVCDKLRHVRDTSDSTTSSCPTAHHHKAFRRSSPDWRMADRHVSTELTPTRADERSEAKR